jgi:hypothetical protein
MKILFVLLALAYVLIGCSRQNKASQTQQTRPDLSKSPSAITPVIPESHLPLAVIPQQQIIAKATAQLENNADYRLKIEAIKTLRKTFAPEACAVLIQQVDYQMGQLPPTLETGYDEALDNRISYMSVLLPELRMMDLPEGNKAVREAVETFKVRFANSKIGDNWIKAFETEVHNAEKDVKMGLHKMNVSPYPGGIH